MKCQVYVEIRESQEEVRIKNSALVRAVLDGMPNSGSGPTGSQGSDLSRRCFPRQSSSSTYTSFVRLSDLNCKWRSRETRDFLPPLVDGVSVGCFAWIAEWFCLFSRWLTRLLTSCVVVDAVSSTLSRVVQLLHRLLAQSIKQAALRFQYWWVCV